MKRKHPTRSAPRWFDAGELATVSACCAAREGDAEAKLTAHCDAIAGAFLASRDGPPTVRFIWSKLDHFFDHVERGRRKRAEDERRARPQGTQRSEGLPGSMLASSPTIPRQQMAADLERIFGPGWRMQSPVVCAP
jgi:hypothetical protein